MRDLAVGMGVVMTVFAIGCYRWAPVPNALGAVGERVLVLDDERATVLDDAVACDASGRLVAGMLVNGTGEPPDGECPCRRQPCTMVDAHAVGARMYARRFNGGVVAAIITGTVIAIGLTVFFLVEWAVIGPSRGFQ